MNPSIREQIADYFVGVLQASGAPAGLTVHRERTRPIEAANDLPAILLYFEDDTPESTAQERQPPLVERSLHIIVELRARVTGGVSSDRTLDPLLVWTDQQITQNETAGGLANNAKLGKITWISKEADVTVAAAIANYHIRYRTARTDPTSRN